MAATTMVLVPAFSVMPVDATFHSVLVVPVLVKVTVLLPMIRLRTLLLLLLKNPQVRFLLFRFNVPLDSVTVRVEPTVIAS